jgi:hypothetical protein
MLDAVLMRVPSGILVDVHMLCLDFNNSLYLE